MPDFLEIFLGKNRQQMTSIGRKVESDQTTCPNRHFPVISTSFWVFLFTCRNQHDNTCYGNPRSCSLRFFSQKYAGVSFATSIQKPAGWAKLPIIVTYALPRFDNAFYPQKWVIVMGKLVAVIIFVCSAWTRGLDFLIRFTL